MENRASIKPYVWPMILSNTYVLYLIQQSVSEFRDKKQVVSIARQAIVISTHMLSYCI